MKRCETVGSRGWGVYDENTARDERLKGKLGRQRRSTVGADALTGTERRFNARHRGRSDEFEATIGQNEMDEMDVRGNETNANADTAARASRHSHTHTPPRTYAESGAEVNPTVWRYSSLSLSLHRIMCGQPVDVLRRSLTDAAGE